MFSYLLFFFVCFKKKAARVGYTNIISSLSLRLASVPLWLSNTARRNCTLPVVHSNYILNILLVRVGRGTYVRTMHIYFRAMISVLEAILCCLHLKVINSFSHYADFVVLDLVNKISFHIVIIFGCYSIPCSYLYHGCPYGAGCTTKRTDTYKATHIAALLCICRFSRSLSLLFCFCFTLQRYCFFLICANFWCKKMHFLYHFSNIGHTKGKMQHNKHTKNTPRNRCEAWKHINITDI